ncbi:MAG: orotidine-5'-phosphate decarboxylase [Gammaproteobacteria bacterium]|nr:orotidine-5'-phosphate decarboxylase [Gammaproteobacteria bacterium]
MSKKPVIVALDYKDADSAMALVEQLNPDYCRVKIGKELFVRTGPQLLEKIQTLGFDIFLDLKFYDIPNTVAAACAAAADLGVWMVNVHASGGPIMMEAANHAICFHSKPPILIAVTVLTSFSEDEFSKLGYQRSSREQVLHLAQLTQRSGLSGVVCSPLEAKMLKQQMGKEFILVTPGVRPLGSDKGDQNRVMTPSEALIAGSDFLVIGRPITAAKNPLKALESILDSL